jgi:small conductance mechanosensitive channel
MFDSLIQKGLDFAPTIVVALLTLVIGFWIIARVANIIEKLMVTRGIDPSVRTFLGSMIGVGLKVMLLLSVAGMFGIQTTSFIAIFTALAFAVGTALSGNLAHFASGVLILVFKPYKVGDLVEIGGQTGTVDSIQVFNTALRTPDNKIMYVPNGVVTSGVIKNISGQGEIRVDMDYTVLATNDIDSVRESILKSVGRCPQVDKSKAVDVVVVPCATPGLLQFSVRPWCNSEHYWDVFLFCQEEIRKDFGKNGITGPVYVTR